ncbi:MAG: hypothetical protein AAF197_07935 [Pseudomonadota bacterium]
MLEFSVLLVNNDGLPKSALKKEAELMMQAFEANLVRPPSQDPVNL